MDPESTRESVSHKEQKKEVWCQGHVVKLKVVQSNVLPTVYFQRGKGDDLTLESRKKKN
jgi:hypothetical protein